MRLAWTWAIIVSLCSTVALAETPGQLIDATPIVHTPAGAQAWRIRYWTTSDQGKPIAVSGFVVAPREALPPQPRKVLAWAHGTWGVVARCGTADRPGAEFDGGQGSVDPRLSHRLHRL